MNPHCPGQWGFSGRNECPCAYCRTVAEARSAWITANERVNRLLNQGASDEMVQRAEAAREAAGARWQAAALGDETMKAAG